MLEVLPLAASSSSGSGSGGAIAVSRAAFLGDDITLNFVVAGDVAGVVFITQNGLIVSQDDYSVTDSTVTFGVAPVAGAEIVVVYFPAALAAPLLYLSESFNPVDHAAYYADGIFPLTNNPIADGVLLVAENGLSLGTYAWSRVGQSIVFVGGPVGEVVIAYFYT